MASVRLTHYLKRHRITRGLSLAVRRKTGVIAGGVTCQSLKDQRVIAEDYTRRRIIL